MKECLQISDHAECVDFVKKFNLPLLPLGGGGYTPKNVARCWALETAVAVGVQVPNEIPPNNAYYQQYAMDDCKLLSFLSYHYLKKSRPF